MGTRASKRLADTGSVLVQGDILDIPFKPETFDYVYLEPDQSWNPELILILAETVFRVPCNSYFPQ
jgi:hypothetical protein